MKLSPTSFARNSIPALLAAVLWMPLNASEAQAKAKPENAAPPTTLEALATPHDARTKIEIENATIQELARLLETQFEGANFVVPKTVANVRVSLKLRNVSLDQVLQAVGFATEQRVAAEGIAENVYGFRLVPRTLPDGRPEPQTAVRVLTLAGVPDLAGEASADHFKKVVEELAKAFDDAIQMLREADPGSTVEQPRLRFHPSTKLLVAVGKPEELSIVEQLVSALGGGFAPYGAGMGSNGYGSASNFFAVPGAAATGQPGPTAQPRSEPGGFSLQAPRRTQRTINQR